MIYISFALYYTTEFIRKGTIMEFTPLFAYIDAGTGSMVLQTVAAGVFAAAVFFRQIRNWVMVQIRPNRKDGEKHDA